MKNLKEQKKQQLDLAIDLVAGRILEKILGYAISEGIDEMIFDSDDQSGKVSFYDAGVLKGDLKFPNSIKKHVFSSLKEISEAKVDRRGEFKKDIPGGKVVFSVSVYISGKEEKIVISLSRGKFEILSIGQLGFEKKVLGRVKDVLEKKGKGLVLVIGPFDSGKTSTLYSFISHINSPDINITTFERQIGIDLPSVNQSSYGNKPGLRQSLTLSSIMRQDPDVVMIDEATDKEAIEAALHLADRGYFVLSGLYGHDLSTTLDFLQGLNVSLPLLVSSAKMIINQRMAVKNCPNCLAKVRIDKESMVVLKKHFKDEAFFNELRERKLVGSDVGGVEDIAFYKSTGCEKCGRRGVWGRVGIFEVVMMNDDVAKAIKEGHFSNIDEEVTKQDCFTLSQSALIKAASGIIPPSEVLKIIKENR